jgi:hypothetical protein
LDPVSPPQAEGTRRRIGLALHALALAGAWCFLPQTLAAGRYALGPGQGRGVVERVVALGLASILVTSAAAWVELRRRPSGSTAALWRKAFVALVAAWLWTVFPQQDWIVARPQPALTASMAALAFSVASLVGAWAPERALRARRALDLGLSSMAVALVVLELGLQAAARASDAPLLARRSHADDDAHLRGLRLAPGTPHLGGRANSRGYVDEEFSERRARPRRAVSIGDSFSIGVVPHAFHFTTVAEDVLRDTEILNLGVPGIGPAQYRLLLEREGLALAPDALLVQLFAGNDLEDYEPAPPVAAWPWLQRGEVMLFLVTQRLAAILRERARSGVDAGELERRLGRDLEEGLAARELERALPHLADPALEPPSYSPERFFAIELQRARLLGSPSQAEYARLLAHLEALVALAGDVRLAFVILPDEFQVDDVLWAEIQAAAGGEPLERERFQSVVTDWARERGVPALDLLPELRAQAPWTDGRPHMHHLRDTHFNRRGNRAAGEILARFLETFLPAPAYADGVSRR